MIKETSNDKIWSMGSKESAARQGKAIQSVIHLSGEIRYNIQILEWSPTKFKSNFSNFP